MRLVFIMLDSVNRRFLKCYGSEEPAITPNLDRLAEKSVVFDNHWVGSSPCMPARRDMLTGRLNFLECPWGGIQPFEDTFPRILGRNNIFSHMETDHFHYAEMGGENYWNQFTSWNLNRGTEHDTINLRPCKGGIPDIESPDDPKEDWLGIYSRSYKATRERYGGKASSFSTPRTLDNAAKWLEESAGADQFMLWAEGFDPHEPFDVAQEFLDLYKDDCTFDPDFFWPPYDETTGYTEEQIHQIRFRYKALLTMSDHYVGKILDVMDAHDMWKDTAVIFTTDHGYLLGEHGFFAKNYMPDYNELMHVPLFVYQPGCEHRHVQAVTQNIDLFPTVLEMFGLSMEQASNPVHGKSMVPLVRGTEEKGRDTALFGQFGKNVNVTDGKYVYMRAPRTEENMPLNIYTAVPFYLGRSIGLDTMKKEDFCQIRTAALPWTDYPVLQYSAAIVECRTSQGFNGRMKHTNENMLFHLKNDYKQKNPLKDDELEKYYCRLMAEAMQKADAPAEQFERLGLQEFVSG